MMERFASTLRKLERHDISRWALTGGLAMEIHCRPLTRAPNDIDFIAASFDCIPLTLANDFLFRHVHPADPPNRTMLQCVDPETSLRVDVFRACGAAMERARDGVASLEDLAARAAGLTMDLAEGVPMPAKHAADFLRLSTMVDAARVEEAWRDHRKPKHPATFQEASSLLRDLIPARPHLLITPEYSKDTEARCARCLSTAAFPLADAKRVLALLGYC